MHFYLSTLHGFVMQHLSLLNGKLGVSQTCAQTVSQALESVAKYVCEIKHRIEILQ